MKNNDTRKMVLFTENCSPYLAGERAAFPIKEANRLKEIKKVVFLDDDGNPIYPAPKKEATNDQSDDANGSESTDDSGDAGKGSKSGKGKGKGKTKTSGKRKRVKA